MPEAFITDVVMLVLEHAEEIHFAGFSHPSAPYQNACWCVTFKSQTESDNARSTLKMIKSRYKQDSIAWADAQVSFL